jgi:hypothetical protein
MWILTRKDMKTKFLVFFLIVTYPVNGQQDLYFTTGIGQSKHFSYDSFRYKMIGFSLKPVVSGKFGAMFVWSKHALIQPYAGIGINLLGSLNKTEDHYPLNPGNSYPFRQTYLSLPVGFYVPVYKSAGVEFSIVNGWNLSDRSSVIIGNPRIWDVAVQPGLYVNLQRWRLSTTYYYGVRDVFGVGIIYNTDMRHFNHAWHFNLSYKLKTFNE